VAEATRAVCGETLAAGKRFGTVGLNLEHTRRVLDLGASLVCHGVDMLLVKQGLEAVKTQFGRLGFGFDGQDIPVQPAARPHYRPLDGVPVHDNMRAQREKIPIT
jgi:hypothetical protein